MHRAVSVLICVVGGAIGSSAMEPTLDGRAIQEALDIAHTSIERTRARFHLDYRFLVRRAPVDFVELVTPFRRLAIAAEARARMGRRMFGQREALEALKPDPERVELYVDLTFHPLNTFVGVPGYDVTLMPARPGAPPLPSSNIDRIPRFGPRIEGLPADRPLPYAIPPRVPSGSEPLSGGTVIVQFDGRRLDPKGVYDAIVTEGKKELASVRIDLSRLR
jgi:hypothetical protein